MLAEEIFCEFMRKKIFGKIMFSIFIKYSTSIPASWAAEWKVITGNGNSEAGTVEMVEVTGCSLCSSICKVYLYGKFQALSALFQ